MNPKTFSFLKSTGIVLSVSGLVGLSAVLADKSFWPAFILVTALQYILFSFVATILSSYYTANARLKEIEKLEPLSTILDCASCSGRNLVTFLPDQDERFEFSCMHCDAKNVVSINFVVAKITEFSDPFLTKTPQQLLSTVKEND